MWLHTDVLRLLSQILRRKAWPLTRYGWAIEFRVCAQRCVCAGGLPWSKMRVVCCLQEGGCEERQQGQERAQEGQDAKALGRMPIVVGLERVMNMDILEHEVASITASKHDATAQHNATLAQPA